MTTTISVIVGSTREGRFAEKPAKWIHQHLGARDGVQAKLLDLRDFPLPFFDQAVPPSAPGRAPYAIEAVQKWTQAIGESDGFIFITAEYNYGPTAVLKNVLARSVIAESETLTVPVEPRTQRRAPWKASNPARVTTNEGTWK